ncbi:MAG: hypothetical protein VR65_06265 [Desulfobulbaceae bacterium BRH_c16a]|nr:MAG: hypothetical protein VR65_25055 [Desulfobulbaceae bacterium BRH_c16a]KJS02242.1 MAG: hypothetical protein VR65_06265 [Desulfobulbaceae bacterium BRH_c16a]
MAYTPPIGSAVNLYFSGEYVPPDGGNILLGGSAPGVAVVVTVDLLGAVSNQQVRAVDSKTAVGNAISANFDTRAAVVTSARISADFDVRATVINARAISADTSAAVTVIVQPAKPDFDVPWGELPALDNQAKSGWKDRRPLTTSIGMGWVKRLIIEAKTSASWIDKGAKDNSRRSSWNDCPRKSNRSTNSRWRDKAASDHFRSISWSLLNAVDVDHGSKSISPPAKDVLVSMLHDVKRILDRGLFIVPWGNPPPNDLLHRTVWGKKYYQEICWRRYEPPPGGNINFNIHVPITLVDDGANIRFHFDQYSYDRRCRHREPSGWRDAYFYIKPGLIPTGPWASVYTMLNTAYLTRLPERTPIDITGMTIGTDWDSLYWTLKSSVGSDAALALLEPTEDGPILVEAAINGHPLKFQVDTWAKNEAFGSRSRSIDGRSISAQLGAPMAEIRTYTEAEARTAQQLMAYELENTGWSVVFDGLDDWLVPGGIHCYQDQTPMQVIKAIADTCRAIVQTDMVAQTIRIKPRYKVAPWQLASAVPDYIIPASMASRIDGGWDARPYFNAVYLAGEAGGISATVTRTGTAGDRQAPMVTSKLITAVEPARALGIATLGASGKWSKHRIELPVFAPPAAPGIILPGSIIEYNLGASSWKGFVAAVSVSAPRAREGLKVRQTIDVERYHGN